MQDHRHYRRSNDRKKYGNKAVRASKTALDCLPCQSEIEEVEGIKCYASIEDVPEPIDRVSMYVPAKLGKEMLESIAARKPAEFFLNPGSEDDELIRRARELGLNPIQACSIVNIGLRPDMYPDE